MVIKPKNHHLKQKNLVHQSLQIQDLFLDHFFSPKSKIQAPTLDGIGQNSEISTPNKKVNVKDSSSNVDSGKLKQSPTIHNISGDEVKKETKPMARSHSIDTLKEDSAILINSVVNIFSTKKENISAVPKVEELALPKSDNIIIQILNTEQQIYYTLRLFVEILINGVKANKYVRDSQIPILFPHIETIYEKHTNHLILLQNKLQDYVKKKTIAPFFGDLYINLSIMEPLLAYSSVFAEAYDALDKKMKKDAKLNKFITTTISRPEFNKKKLSQLFTEPFEYINLLIPHLENLASQHTDLYGDNKNTLSDLSMIVNAILAIKEFNLNIEGKRVDIDLQRVNELIYPKVKELIIPGRKFKKRRRNFCVGRTKFKTTIFLSI